MNQKKSADGLARQLERDGFKVTSLHGGKIQEQREVSLEGFRQKKFTILVATDVAGRGIDIPVSPYSVTAMIVQAVGCPFVFLLMKMAV